MKSTGIVRKVDGLGRIVVPMELRRTLMIGEKDELEIFNEEDMIILKKFEPFCVFCRSVTDIVEFSGKNICKSCIAEALKL